jgi:hypothetical protein
MMTAAIALTIVVCAARMPPHGTIAQLHHLRLSEERIPRVRAVLQADPRFTDVEVGMDSGHGGLAIVGYVEAPDDLFRLMRAVAAERLPVAISWNVRVRAEDAGR